MAALVPVWCRGVDAFGRMRNGSRNPCLCTQQYVSRLHVMQRHNAVDGRLSKVKLVVYGLIYSISMEWH